MNRLLLASAWNLPPGPDVALPAVARAPPSDFLAKRLPDNRRLTAAAAEAPAAAVLPGMRKERRRIVPVVGGTTRLDMFSAKYSSLKFSEMMKFREESYC